MNKNPLDELKELTSRIDKKIFDFDSQSFLDLEKKIIRNDSYMLYTLFISQHLCHSQQKGITLKDIAKGIQKDDGYVQKITDVFVRQDLISKTKILGKNIYILNSDPEKLKSFIELVKTAKKRQESMKKVT